MLTYKPKIGSLIRYESDVPFNFLVLSFMGLNEDMMVVHRLDRNAPDYVLWRNRGSTAADLTLLSEPDEEPG